MVAARRNEAARKPAYVLEVDLGPDLGVRTGSAQITELYGIDDLIGRQVAAVVNFPPRQIAKIMSEILVLGFPDSEGRVVLVGVDRPVPNGGRMF